VLEVAFNNLMRSDRHASRLRHALFPRIMRIRDDKPVQEIDTFGPCGEDLQPATGTSRWTARSGTGR